MSEKIPGSLIPSEPGREESEGEKFDYEKVLADFSSRPLDEVEAEDWELGLKRHIKLRLEGKPDRSYLMALRVAATSMNQRKEEIITAALLNELDHQDQILEVRNYNKAVLFRLALEKAEEGGFIGENLDQRMEQIPLQDIAAAFIDNSKVSRNAEDLPRLSNLALERMDSESPAAQKVIDKATKEIFRPFHRSRELEARTFYATARMYKPGAIDKIISGLQEKNHPVLEELYGRFDDDLAKAKDIPLTPAEFSEFVKDKDRVIIEDLERRRDSKIFVNRMLESVPHLSAGYKDHRREIDEREGILKREQEQQAQEQSLRDEQARRVREARDVQETAAANERYRQEQQERLNQNLDHLIRWVEEGKLNTTEPSLPLYDSPGSGTPLTISPKDWDVILVPGEREDSWSSLNGRIIRTVGDAFGDPPKKEYLQKLWDRKSPELKTEIDEFYKQQAGHVLAQLEDHFTIVDPGKTQEIEEKLKQVEKFLKYEREAAEAHPSSVYAEVLGQIIERMAEKRTTWLAEVERAHHSRAELERTELVAEIQKGFLLEQIGAKTTYLKNLYAAETGLDLTGVEGQGQAYDGGSIGTVSIGQGQSMRLEQRLEQRLELFAPKDGIFLEMGEDLETIKRRELMVEWVAPHEIGHLVDWSIGNITNGALEKHQSQVEGVIGTFEGEKGKLAREMLELTFRECVVDGTGFRLVQEYGTSNPFDQERSQRTSTTVAGFNTTMDVFKSIVEREATTPELKSRYSFIILRMGAVGEELAKSAADNKVEDSRLQKLNEHIQGLGDLFDKLNQETNFVNSDQRQQIKALCKQFFRHPEEISLKSAT